MKYIIESLRNTKAGKYFSLLILMTIFSLFLSNMEMRLISKVVDTESMSWFHIYLGVVVLMSLANWAAEYLGSYRYLMVNYMHLKLIRKILNADYKMFGIYPPGTLAKAVNDVPQVINLVRLIFFACRDLINVIIIIYFIGMINKVVVIPTIVVLLIVAIIIAKIMKIYVKLDHDADNIKTTISNEEDEIVNGFVEVRSYPHVAEKHFQRMSELKDELYASSIKKKWLSVLINVNASVWGNLISVGVLLYVLLMKDHGFMGSNSEIITLIVYTWRLIDPVISIACRASDVSELLPKLSKYSKIMEYENEIVDGKIELEEFNDGIQIKNVSFGYEKSSNVLENISIEIKKGEHIGICGSSGCGKSTLLNLLNRFYDVDKGSISIDGIDIRKLSAMSRRKFVGTIHQTPYIFNGTIRANIEYGIDRQVTDTELVEACKKASIYDFIIGLDEGFDTMVGPRGMKLSGGQKQRISIARLFLLNPEIIILDEATSALDNDTEAAIQDAMRIFNDKTVISVAHRLSTIKDSDTIYVFAEHTIAESGSHEELMEKKGIYAEMYR